MCTIMSTLAIKGEIALTEQSLEIIDSLERKAFFMDDNEHMPRDVKLSGMVLLIVEHHNEQFMCPIKADVSQSLHGFYLEDGFVHLSSWTIGGVVDSRYYTLSKVLDKLVSDHPNKVKGYVKIH